MIIHEQQAQVMSNQHTGGTNHLLVIKSLDIALRSQPGQFVHLRCSKGLDPLLRRPLSICLADPIQGLVYLWYQVVGKGTELLSALQPGDTVDLMGPLGRGFQQVAGKKVVLVGGGMGIAPLIFLGHALAGNNQAVAFFGARSEEHLPPRELFPPVEGFLATEDGSAGYQGFVTTLLEDWLEMEEPELIYACGPQGMLKQVVDLAEKEGISLQVSLETVMACGVGACLGCTCESARGKGDSWLKVCQDGPVFWAQEVNWK